MRERFTAEELNIIRVYESPDRKQAIADIKICLPHVYDRETLKAMQAGIEKLENITDTEYAELNYCYHGEYDGQEMC